LIKLAIGITFAGQNKKKTENISKIPMKMMIAVPIFGVFSS